MEIKMTKVMIVDDEPDLREIISIMINNESFEPKTVVDGSDFQPESRQINANSNPYHFGVRLF